MNLNIVRVLALPNPLVANTVYLHAVSLTELQITVVGNTLADVRKTVIGGNVDASIAAAVAALTLNSSAGLSSGVANAISTALAGITIDTSVTLKSGINSAITAAIGALDLSNSAQIVPTIAARDALVLTKNSFVVVSDATGDATVSVGAAMYFYNIADDSFTKIAEYESMDLTIPNKAILEQFSDVAGQLKYKGAFVGTVQVGTNEW